jgi:hypothetical protein
MGSIQPSYQGRLFNDPDLKESRHDLIMKWLDRRAATAGGQRPS